VWPSRTAPRAQGETTQGRRGRKVHEIAVSDPADSETTSVFPLTFAGALEGV